MNTLLYIASNGFSGSTLLEMLLGSNSAVTNLGEIALLPRYAGDNLRCTCGCTIGECEFWQSIEQAMRIECGEPSLSLASYAISPANRPAQSLHRKLPTLVDALVLLGNRRLWHAATRVSSEARDHVDAANRSITLFETIARTVNTPVILDSSKYPRRLKSLYLAAPERVKVIYLVRDGRAVTCSLMKHKDCTVEVAAKRWVRFNWNLALTMKSIPKEKVFFLRYEDLCLKTSEVLEELARFLAIPNAFHSEQIDKSKFHSIGGNPMRFRRGESEIVLDEKWKGLMSEQDVRCFQGIGGKLNRSLGYTD